MKILNSLSTINLTQKPQETSIDFFETQHISFVTTLINGATEAMNYLEENTTNANGTIGETVVVTASAYTLAAIALERYYAICRPLQSRIWHTRTHAKFMISLVWSIYMTVMLLVIPLVAMTVLYGNVISTLSSGITVDLTSKEVVDSASARKSKSDGHYNYTQNTSPMEYRRRSYDPNDETEK
uniref:G_PROTEIN_RECEP_F1_2 domain-containing protein n=1 Tax=Meloidogyne hapla TaxID=6305 RepID=A0A1I8BCQ1_MELHA